MLGESVVYSASGGWQWGGGPVVTLVHPEAWQSDADSSTLSWEFLPPTSARPALQALDRLWERIRVELEIYREHVTAMNDDARLQWVGWAERWLETGGMEIYRELRSIIKNASSCDQKEMAEALQAAEQLVEVSHKSLQTPEEWDVILDWARGILPSLRRAFKRFQGQPVVEVRVDYADTRKLVEPFVSAWLQNQRLEPPKLPSNWMDYDLSGLCVPNGCEGSRYLVAA